MKCAKIDFAEVSRQVLNKGACLHFQAKGCSMSPVIRDGDILNVYPLNGTKVRLGDVIFYENQSKQLTVHRVIKRVFNTDSKVLVVKGDSNIDRGEEVTLKQILGRVEAIERDGCRIILGRGWGRLTGVLYARISPFFKYFRLIGSKVLRQVQGLRLYRRLAKRVIRGGIFYQSEIDGNSGIHLFAKRNGRIIGRTSVFNSQDGESHYPGWWIFGTWVFWRYRGLGIAGHLTKMACEAAAEGGAPEVRLLVFEDNRPALRLYQKMGFRQITIPEIDRELKAEAKRFSRQRIIMAKNL